MKEVILTPEGYEKLKVEIEHLSTDKRREVADRIRIAREFGDISENAEYDHAKNEQAMLEHKIAQLEERLSNARVIQKRDVDLSVVSIGAQVKVSKPSIFFSAPATSLGTTRIRFSIRMP